MNTPAPETWKCPVCPIVLNNISRESWLAKMLCNAATDESFFTEHGAECLAMVLFTERELKVPESAEELRNRMKELRKPLS